MKKTFIIILFIAIFTKIFGTIGEVQFRYPIDIIIEASQKKVVVGDIVDIVVTAKLNKSHKDYEENDKYVILSPKNTLVYALNEQKQPPGKLENAINWYTEKYGKNRDWEITYSDDDVILDSHEEIKRYSFKIKINKKPRTKYIKIPLEIHKFDKIENYGGYPNYIYSKSSCRYKHERDAYYIELEYDDPSLKESTENSYTGLPVAVKKNESPENIKIIEFEAFELETELRTTYKVLINSIIEISLNNNVSNVSCNPNIGFASGNGNVITFSASGNEGATGLIYYRMDDTDYGIEIQLISSYDIKD